MKLTPEDIGYLRERAGQTGYNADDLLKAINYESGGRTDIWGGKGGNYYGLIQFGPNERQQFGVDTAHPNARNQIDATFNFLGARGFKPGMGLMDLYSTILAGSPGHYNSSDGAGTVSSHVARMMGMKAYAPSAGGVSSVASSGLPSSVVAGLLAGSPSSASADEQRLSELLQSSGSGSSKTPRISVPAEEDYAPGKMASNIAPTPEAHRPSRKRPRGLL